jgi:UDP-N-acetyl-D-glucosamine dehydrogenase
MQVVDYYTLLKSKIQEKNLTIGVVGLGYVGLPLSIAISNHGLKALGFDILRSRTDLLNSGKSYLKGIEDDVISKAIDSGSFNATSNMTRLFEVDVIIICVPTPLSKNRGPDLSYVENTADIISKNIRKGQLVVLESTTYPGTTVGVVKPTLERSGLKSGEDFFSGLFP